jgi:CheY-like chemotaxis protein
VVASQWLLHRDVNGRLTRILEVNADITALKQAEALMRSQKLEALGILAGGIAHDFNNILAAINGSASLAISQFPPQHPVQAWLMEIGYDAVLTDLSMPGMSGLQLAVEIRKVRPNLPVILTSNPTIGTVPTGWASVQF